MMNLNKKLQLKISIISEAGVIGYVVWKITIGKKEFQLPNTRLSIFSRKMKTFPHNGKQISDLEWERIQKTYLHTLGNLTLTGYNSEYSDRPFIEKRDIKGGFAESPLRLNDGLSNLQVWTEKSINDRGNTLSEKAVSVWPVPEVEPSILEAYKPKPITTTYSIGDHIHLSSGPMREIFEAFRKQVLDIDPVVREEFLKLYVAYKAETNFVDVVPQVKRLRLSLNIPFPEINDPRGICRDVSGLDDGVTAM